MATIKHDNSDEDQSIESRNMDDHQIMNMSVKDLNALLKTMKPNEAAIVKRRRRILKNKGYAASSRYRQTSMVDNLSVERNRLLKQISHLTRDNQNLSEELRGWKQRYSDLQLLTSPPAVSSVPNSMTGPSTTKKESSE